MKTFSHFSRFNILRIPSRQRLAKLLFCLCLGVAAIGMIGCKTRQHEGFIAHEWGTFTSVQGGDGILLDWRPLETTRLPKFVYNWTKPGLNRRAVGVLGFGKGSFVTLQRMETPVIYFYTEKEQTVDLSVRFPKGLITEWYPQARKIGPSTTAANPALAALDDFMHKAGLQPAFTFTSALGTPGVKESLVHWKGLQILPADQNRNIGKQLSIDASGSHYFAARETDAAFVRASSLVRTNPLPEQEKFLFYRGVGSFATPLRVTMKSNREVTLENTAKENLAHLFLLNVQDHLGTFTYLEQLQPGEQRTIPIDTGNQAQPPDRLVTQLSNAMAAALVQEGLYRREAAAMVNTWKDSWFEEEGVRVLYVLPRAWTDRTLPMTIDPQPRELVRVMVGRAEIIPPDVEEELATQLAKVNQGDNQARERVQTALKRLGRFAEPALQRATRRTVINSAERNKLMAWLYDNSKAN